MKKRNLKISVLVLMTASLSACGGQAYREDGGGNTGNVPSSQSGPTNTGTTTTNNGNNPTVVGTVDNTVPMQSQSVILSNTAGTKFDSNGNMIGNYPVAATSQTISGIITDNQLRVVVSAGSPQVLQGTGFTVGFNCLQVRVTVNGSTQTAFVSGTGAPGVGFCNGAQTSQTLNFDGQLTPGHGAMSVKLDTAMYDNCRLYGNVYVGGCQLSSVYFSHTVQYNVGIQTNGTN